MPQLKNPRHEAFAQLVAAGSPRYKAYEAVYGPQRQPKTAHRNAARLWGHLKGSEELRSRVHYLMEEKRKAADFSRDDVLDEIVAVAQLATAAQQLGVARQCWVDIGKEAHRMFTERRENVNLNVDFASKQEIHKWLVDHCGQDLGNQLWKEWNPQKQIEHRAKPINTDNKASNTETVAEDWLKEKLR